MIDDLNSLTPTPEDTATTLAAKITDQVNAELPEEKKIAEAQLLQTAQELQERGSDFADGRGQAIASIPPRIYIRWHQLLPGCWQDKQFVMEFLKDNPQCRAPGYTPKFTDARHGFRMGVSFYQQNKEKVAKD